MESCRQVSVAARWCLVGNVSQWFCLQIGLSEVVASSSSTGRAVPGGASGTAISDKGAAVSKGVPALTGESDAWWQLLSLSEVIAPQIVTDRNGKNPGSSDKLFCDGGESAIAQDLLFVCPVRACVAVIILWTSTRLAVPKGADKMFGTWKGSQWFSKALSEKVLLSEVQTEN